MDRVERELKALSFGAVADHYEQGRPAYPEDAIRWIVTGTRAKIIDLAAGTGKLTRQFRAHGHEVVGVEPSIEMLHRLRRLDGGTSSIAGAAERLPIRNDYADVVTVAQAFHWFDPELALPEIRRVLRPRGRLALMWNLRDESVNWVRELSRIIGSSDAQVSGVKDSERFANDPSHGAISNSGLFGPIEHGVFEHRQTLDRSGVMALVMSRSNIAVLDERQRRGVLQQVSELFETHPDVVRRDRFILPYKSHVFRMDALA